MKNRRKNENGLILEIFAWWFFDYRMIPLILMVLRSLLYL